MLTHLLVQNYALLRRQEIDFREGFSVITGETGAGKSILLGALGLILGKRADSHVLLEPSKKCLVEGTFAIENYHLESFFRNHDLDYEPLTIIRREINPQGKSRAFINDTPITLPILKEFASRLIDVHSQHENLNLGNGRFQLQVLDSFCGNQERLIKYQEDFIQFRSKIDELEILKEKERKAESEKDYLDFIFNELVEANLKQGEQEQLESELELLNHAEEIKSGIYEAGQALIREDHGILNQLHTVESTLRKIAVYGSSFQELFNRIESATIELADIQSDIDNLEENLKYDPQKLDEVNSRLHIIYSMQSKHHLHSIDDLLELKNRLKNQLASTESLSLQIGKMENDIAALKKHILKKARELSKKREDAFPEFNREMTDKLKLLGMPDARFTIQSNTMEEPGMSGLDNIRYLFTANKGSTAEDISRVASGGEKSRLMLAVKSMISEKQILPTIIFDEIDTGVSGAVAEKVGMIMKSLAKKMQVIVITHLPQIAGKADTQYQVLKKNDESIASTHIYMLRPEERILEIARLLSGQEITDASVESARHLLKN